MTRTIERAPDCPGEALAVGEVADILDLTRMQLDALRGAISDQHPRVPTPEREEG
jgi:hypothetical protein